MSYEVYFPECVETRLDGLEGTAQYMEAGDFRDGFLAALQEVRASFGLPQTVFIIRAVAHGRTANGTTGLYEDGL